MVVMLLGRYGETGKEVILEKDEDKGVLAWEKGGVGWMIACFVVTSWSYLLR